MNVAVINRTIRSMCLEVTEQDSASSSWRRMSEEALLYEAVICIFGSQLLFEMAVATADRLRDLGLIRCGLRGTGKVEYTRYVVDALSAPLRFIDGNGKERIARPRFKNRLAALLTATVENIYGQSQTIKGVLSSAGDARHARALLIRWVSGFGPKQASLYLRRVGYCSDLAVLDVHVLDYLQLSYGLSLQPSRLSCLSVYEEIEDAFRGVAAEFGFSLGCVDLATWLTMRVAKREAFI